MTSFHYPKSKRTQLPMGLYKGMYWFNVGNKCYVRQKTLKANGTKDKGETPKNEEKNPGASVATTYAPRMALTRAFASVRRVLAAPRFIPGMRSTRNLPFVDFPPAATSW